MRRLLGFCAVAMAILVSFVALRLNHAVAVSAAVVSSNLELVSATGQPGCPLGPAFTFCDQIPGAGVPPGTTSPATHFVIQALAAVSGVSVSLVAVPGLATSYNPDDFTIAFDSCAGSLAANEQCEVDIAFHPTTPSLREAALTLADSAGDMLTLNLAGTGRNLVMAPPASAPTCTPPIPTDNAFMYCPEAVHATSAAQVFTLTSSSAVTGLHVALAAILGLASEFNAADFTIQGTTCTTMLNGSCTLDMAFSPTTAGLRAAALTATDAAGDTTTVYLAGNANSGLAISGPMASPACSLGSPFDFCNEPSGGNTATTEFTLTNTSGVQLTGLSVPGASAANNFRVASTSCVSTLAASASCTMNVDFAPQTTGLLQDTITITDNAGDVGAANFAGTGDDYELQLASGQASELTVVQGDTITFNAQVAPDGVFGQNGEQVALQCPANLPPFTSCTIAPCPGPATVNSLTNYKIVFVTSSSTMIAPVPNPSIPPGCTGYGVPSSAELTTPRGIGPASHLARPKLALTPLFPTLAILALMGMIGTIDFVRAIRRWIPALGRVPSGVVLVIFALAIAIVATLSGCHHGSSSTTSSGTPLGQTVMQIQGAAFDSHGNPLNATRGLPVITIDVVAQ
ncbi:MAG: choice-of-anchor D domain-containing protein [Candidatus Acidiferrales bacterium]